MKNSLLAVLLALPAFASAEPTPVKNVPGWSEGVTWYQIFPERFRNGDPSNDPTRESLEWPIRPGATWEVSDWTADWYSRQGWEKSMGDSFYSSVLDRRYGGDMQGVIDQLDYLKGLGITALYFNPVFYARSLHKYDGNSFHHIDPFFGPDPAGDFQLMLSETADPETWHWTAADKLFLEMVKQAHARGMRVIIDGVWNHTGRDFFAFRNLMDNQQASPYVDWYIVKEFDDPETARNEFDYESWWGFKSLPIFADTPDGKDQHAGPKAYIFAATKRWMDPNGDGDTADGIDGWRLDVSEEIPVGFWQDWNTYVRELNPEAYTSAEIWGNAQHFLAERGFSACMNYYGFAYPVKGWMVDNAISATAFSKMLDERRNAYPYAQFLALMNLMDSHDTERVASTIANRLQDGEQYLNADGFDYDNGARVSPQGDPDYVTGKPDAASRQIQRMVGLMQAAYPGSPMLYYGTEAGMWGADDPDDRMPMLWPDLEFDPMVNHPTKGKFPEPQEVAFDKDLHDFYAKALAQRGTSEALRTGDYKTLLADDAKDVFGFARQSGDEVKAAVFNRSATPQSVLLDLPPNGQFTILLSSDGEPALTPSGNRWQLTLPPVSGVLIGEGQGSAEVEVAAGM